ncbi:MAG: hypothetical protein EGP85_13115 [Bifidobacterium bifidum]|nr:hypothetical protein [Bifidobacterium bifidum]
MSIQHVDDVMCVMQRPHDDGAQRLCFRFLQQICVEVMIDTHDRVGEIVGDSVVQRDGDTVALGLMTRLLGHPRAAGLQPRYQSDQYRERAVCERYHHRIGDAQSDVVHGRHQSCARVRRERQHHQRHQ